MGYRLRRVSASCYMLFFLQAEAGIRDLTVTGVQTCALPISLDLFLLAKLGTLGHLRSRREADGVEEPRALGILQQRLHGHVLGWRGFLARYCLERFAKVTQEERAVKGKGLAGGVDHP